MILVTVGTQMPFDRLIRAVDELTPRLGLAAFAQVGRSKYLPKNIEFSQSMRPDDFDVRFREADLIVAHAGIGTVLSALRHKKPTIIYPRRANLGEHRNDHQMATCEQLSGRAGIYIAEDDAALERLLSRRDLEHPDEASLSERRLDFVQALGAEMRRLIG